MSNQKIDTHIMALMSEYVNGLRPFYLAELEGAIYIAKSMQDDHKEYVHLKGDMSKISALQSLIEYKTDDNTSDSLSENDESLQDVSESGNDTNVVIKTRKRRSVWKDNFINKIKPDSLNFFQKNPIVDQKDFFTYFEQKFGDEIPAADKVKSGKNGRPLWQLKLHDNVNVWFVKTGLLIFSNSKYAYIGSSLTKKEAEQTSLEL